MIEGSGRRAAAALALLSAAVISGCSDDSPPAEAAGGLPSSLQGIAGDTIFEIGAAQGESWQTFGGIWDVDVSPSGFVALLDIETGQVHVYDEAGGHVGSVSQKGVDPGALEAPAALAWGGAGDLLVWDPGTSNISDFNVSSAGVEFEQRWPAFAFGETGFCADGERRYMSYWQDGLVVHQIGNAGVERSFGAVPEIPGMETLGPELQEIAVEELSPSELLCTPSGVLDVAFFGSKMRLHDSAGALVWEKKFEEFNPMSVFTPDSMGLGRQFDEAEGSSLLHSVLEWGDEHAMIQHEIRTAEFVAEGEVPVVESRLVRLADGAEVDRTRELPRVLASWGRRLYIVVDDPFPKVVVLETGAE